MEELAERVKAHVEGLAAFNIPAKLASTEPNEVKVAYEAGLKVAHQKTGAEVCEMLGVDPRKGLNISYALQRLSKYGDNAPNPVEVKLYGSQSACDQRATRSYAILRGEEVSAVRTKDIVVGDIIYLEAGDHVPADVRVLKASKNREEKFEFNTAKGIHEKFLQDVGTIIDNTLPGGIGPSPVVSGSSTQSSIEQANNVALKGSTIISGSLLGVVFGIGPRVALASINPASYLKESNHRLPRGIDKKKLAKVVAKMGTLGANVKQADRVVPFCGARRIAIALSLSKSNIASVNVALKRFVALDFPVFLFVKPSVNPSKLAQISCLTIGKPFDKDNVHTIVDDATAKAVAERLKDETVVLGTGPDIAFEYVVKNIKERLEYPVAVYGHDATDRIAMESANLSLAPYIATPSLLAAADVICEINGLERLALFLKLLKESTEIIN